MAIAGSQPTLSNKLSSRRETSPARISFNVSSDASVSYRKSLLLEKHRVFQSTNRVTSDQGAPSGTPGQHEDVQNPKRSGAASADQIRVSLHATVSISDESDVSVDNLEVENEASFNFKIRIPPSQMAGRSGMKFEDDKRKHSSCCTEDVLESWEDIDVEEMSCPAVVASAKETNATHNVKVKPMYGTPGVDGIYYTSEETKPMWANSTRRKTWNRFSEPQSGGRLSDVSPSTGGGFNSDLDTGASVYNHSSSSMNWRRSTDACTDCPSTVSAAVEWRDSFKEQFFIFQTPYIDSHCHIDFLYRRQRFQGTFEKYRQVNADTFPPNYHGCVAVFCHPPTWTMLSRGLRIDVFIMIPYLNLILMFHFIKCTLLI